jgi:Fur family ferric uptake transcriptional regulator
MKGRTRRAVCDAHDADHAALLRRAGLRVTGARVAIIDTLCHAERALDVSEVLDEMKRRRAGERLARFDRVTVYRTLASLAESGIAHRVDVGDRVFRFALAGAGGHARHAPGRAHAKPRRAPGVPGGGGARGASDHVHPHFVCDSCGRVECLDGLTVVLRHAGGPGAGAAAVKFEHERRVVRREVLLHGTCGRCAGGA